jgi:putative transposase
VYGFDGGKLIKGRKRFIFVDTLGRLISVLVINANCSEQRGILVVHETDEAALKSMQLIWVDQGYQGENFAHVIDQWCGAKVEVVKRSESGFVILPKRWIVERTLGWLNQNRRLSKDYELLPEVSEAMIQGAMIRLMLLAAATTAKAIPVFSEVGSTKIVFPGRIKSAASCSRDNNS